MRWLPLAALVALSGCELLAPPAPPTTAKVPATAKPERSDRPKTEAAQKPSELPPVPKADEKSKVTALNEAGTLYVETKPDGTKRVLVAAEVCLREGPLEVFLCRKNTKEHESIVRIDMDARFLHAALVAMGAKVGKPVQFVNPKTGEAEYKPASGQGIAVTVSYTMDGKPKSHPAQEWILDKATNKPMAQQWVFAGSRFAKNPDAPPTDPDHYCANNGEVIAISNFVDSMLDLPVAVSQDNSDLAFDARTAKIPPLGSKVWVILEPVPEKN